ncbi:hypothetical protein DH2020_037402 [Rehmannia glutinosa]|uniref:Uncharacterized protein n=1 Tax=Rehmannia glutinosa TaxID=99300 RepID=A0ABR0V3G3_REHGL
MGSNPLQLFVIVKDFLNNVDQVCAVIRKKLEKQKKREEYFERFKRRYKPNKLNLVGGKFGGKFPNWISPSTACGTQLSSAAEFLPGSARQHHSNRAQIKVIHHRILRQSQNQPTLCASNQNHLTSAVQLFVFIGSVFNHRGRVPGSSSAINAGFYTHANSEHVREAGWDPRLVNESYEFRPRVLQWQAAVRDGLIEAGVFRYRGLTFYTLSDRSSCLTSIIVKSLFDHCRLGTGDDCTERKLAQGLGKYAGKRISEFFRISYNQFNLLLLKSLETTLAGSLRRKQMAETSIKQLEAEIEHTITPSMDGHFALELRGGMPRPRSTESNFAGKQQEDGADRQPRRKTSECGGIKLGGLRDVHLELNGAGLAGFQVAPIIASGTLRIPIPELVRQVLLTESIFAEAILFVCSITNMALRLKEENGSLRKRMGKQNNYMLQEMMDKLDQEQEMFVSSFLEVRSRGEQE